MGDYPIKQVRSPIELTDQIFGPATQHKLLQDEIYCQIMRQMTSNNNRSLTVCLRACVCAICACRIVCGNVTRFLKASSKLLCSPQVEHGARVAADVVVFGLVPAQSVFDEARSTFPGVTTQRTHGCRMSPEAAADAQVRQKKKKKKVLAYCSSASRGECTSILKVSYMSSFGSHFRWLFMTECPK